MPNSRVCFDLQSGGERVAADCLSGASCCYPGDEQMAGTEFVGSAEKYWSSPGGLFGHMGFSLSCSSSSYSSACAALPPSNST